MTYKRFIYLWLVIVMFSGGLRAQMYTDHIVRSYRITPNSSVEVYNKYGKVHVITWDKDSVRFEIDLRISTNNPQKLEKLKKNIDFDFTSTNYYVVAKTSFTKSAGIIREFVDEFIPSNQVVINYVVFIPKQATFKIENKFGDVFIDDFAGNLELVLSNGDLKANSLTGNTSIKLSSGDGVINSFEKGKIYVSYSDLHIKSSNKLNMDTRSSRITIDNASYLKMSSRRDKYFINQVSEVHGDTYFSTLNISDLSKEFNCTLKYGGITISQIPRTISFINVTSEYTDIDLFFERASAYNLDITHHQDVLLNIPKASAKIETKELDKDDKQLLTYGTIGANVSVNSPKVKLTATKKCVINIIHK